MAQQSARRGRKNQMYSSCLEHAFMIWFQSANSHTGPQLHRCIEAGQMAASDYVPIFFKNHLRLAGRPQMSSWAKHRRLPSAITRNVTIVTGNERGLE
jgi:hypothetical protein